jgi:AraC-like DNA-binding protein
MKTIEEETRGSASGQLHICDSEFYPRREAFCAYKEAVAKAFMPWHLEPNPDSEFSARFESLSTRTVTFAHVNATPLVGTRTKNEILKSPEHCLYANYTISGQIVVEQGNRSSIANEGDLIICDSSLPIRHVKAGSGPIESLTFSVPKALVGLKDRIVENVAIPAAKIMIPLAGCLEFLSQNLTVALPDELCAVGTACAALLVAAPDYSVNRKRSPFDAMANKRAREMLQFINARIADRSLSPTSAAEHLGISVRYVHKQFALHGTTFNNYVSSKRLEHIGRDLISDAGRHQTIAALAYRWGFNDVPHFVKTFKKKFGCPPREYRSKFR